MFKYFLSFCLCLLSFYCFGANKDPSTINPSAPIEHTLDNLSESDHQFPSYKQSLVRMGLALAGLLAVLVVTIWLYKKLTGGKFSGIHASKRIRIIERRPISAKSILYLIECDGKKILVAESQFEMRTLAKIDEPNPEEYPSLN